MGRRVGWAKRSVPTSYGGRCLVVRVGTKDVPTLRLLMQQDPHIKFYNAQRGYVRHVVTPERWQADYQVLDKVTVPDGRTTTRKSFVVENGNSRLVDA